MTYVEDMRLNPSMPYRRHLEGADFSLEANTDSVPHNGRFYLLRNGKVTMESEAFAEAMEAYQGLCKEFWTGRLESADARVRLSSAWGLVGLEPNHPAALQVIRDDGTENDAKRLEQVRRKKRFAAQSAGRYAKNKKH